MAFKIEKDEYNNKHILFSEVYDLGPIEINYKGQLSEIPMIITFTAAKGEVYNPVLFNSNTKEKIQIDTSKLPDGKLLLGDSVEINTTKGNVSATLIRGSERTNILDAVTEDSTWLTLTGGLNYFNYDSRSSYAEPPPSNLKITYINLVISIKADLVYEGV